MPFASVSDIPGHVKKYPAKTQRQWMHVFNSTYRKILKETGKASEAERRAFMAANSVLKRGMSKLISKNSLTHNEKFDYVVDLFLGRLKG